MAEPWRNDKVCGAFNVLDKLAALRISKSYSPGSVPAGKVMWSKKLPTGMDGKAAAFVSVPRSAESLEKSNWAISAGAVWVEGRRLMIQNSAKAAAAIEVMRHAV